MADIYLYKNKMWRVKHAFTYTGDKQEFTLTPGKYLCICKGAKGGGLSALFQNLGGCSYGILNLQSPLTAYAVVGGDGGDGTVSVESPGLGGYNGGGDGGWSCYSGRYCNGAGGGGGTDIRLTNQDIETIIETRQIPDGLDEVEYIEADGTQYFSSDVIPNQDTSVEADVTFHQSFSGWLSMWGSQYRNAEISYTMIINSLNTTSYQRGYQFHDDSYYFSLNTPYTIKTSYRDLFINDVRICTLNYQSDFTCVCPMAVFSCNTNGNNITTCIPMRLHKMKIWDGETLIRYYVPFKNTGVVMNTSAFSFEQGTITNGSNAESMTTIRTSGYIPISNVQYISGIANGINTMKLCYVTYNSERNFISTSDWVYSEDIVDIGSGSAYVRVCVCNEDGSAISTSGLTSFELHKHSMSVKSGAYDLVNKKIYPEARGNDFATGNIVQNKTTYTGTYDVKVGLLSRIMVAGGAGGTGHLGYLDDFSDFTSFGGGVNGGYPHMPANSIHNHEPSTQTSGYEFGKGEDALTKTYATSPASDGGEGISGGGGGWYGGFTSNITDPAATRSSGNGGGGSGYILTESSYKPEDYMHGIPERNDLYFSDTLMTAGLAETSCVLICEPVESYLAGDRIICDCIGEGTRFKLYAGEYKIRCTGGQGSHRSKYRYCSKGGYSEGILNNPRGTYAYAYVGGSGIYSASYLGASFVQTTHPTNSFNGGGNPSSYSEASTGGEAGGGGTDLRIGTDSLYARIIVAGGAGGSGKFESYGGAGGGTSGNSPYNNGAYAGTNYGPGTQSSAGAGSDTTISGGFGYGGNGVSENSGFGGAGGGGWYGGSGTRPNESVDNDLGGSGGSGYVLTDSSYKPSGYLLGEEYYLTDTQIITGSQDTLFSPPVTKLIIDVLDVVVLQILAHDNEGYKYYDENDGWVFLQTTEPTIDDFETYGISNFVDDTGLLNNYTICVYDPYNTVNTLTLNVLPPPGEVRFRYHTSNTITKYSIESDVDMDAVDFNISTERRGVAEDAYIYFKFEYDVHDIPEKDTRVYCVSAFTQGSSLEYHEPRPIVPVDPPEHRDLLPVGDAIKMPSRFKNYIGSFINGTEAITTINSAVSCEHNRCIYSATLCNDSVVRFAKLNLITNTSTVIKDIPKSLLGNTYYGDIKVDDNYIYLTASTINDSRTIWRTPNGPDSTISTFQTTNSDSYKLQGCGRMEWYNNHTLILLMRKGVAFFDTETESFSYKIFADGGQNGARRDWAVGKYHLISLYTGESNSAWIIDPETGSCEGMAESYFTWTGTYLNCACYYNGKFYVVQRNALHIVDDETFTLEKVIPTPFVDIDPKQIVAADGVLYITMMDKYSLYMFDIESEIFYATGLPFVMDNYTANGWIRMCSFKGYGFIPQIRLYAINFVNRSKYNLGYKYDQFMIVTNKANSEIEDNQYEYDNRFVTFTDDNMWIHAGDLEYHMEDDPINHIKTANISKDQYNKIIQTSFSNIEISNDDDESEGT